MCSFICVRFDGKPYKIAWVNEDHIGVYLGSYGKIAGSHVSYHLDGTCHKKIPTSKAPIQAFKSVPIADIMSLRHIVTQAIPLSREIIEISGFAYDKEDQLSSSAIFLDELNSVDKQLSIYLYILHKTQEPVFIDTVFNINAQFKQKILVCHVSPLDNFPHHKVGLVLAES